MSDLSENFERAFEIGNENNLNFGHIKLILYRFFLKTLNFLLITGHQWCNINCEVI